MKKALSLLLAGLTFIASLSFIGCKKDEDESSNAASENQVLLADFENWSNFSMLALYNRFGRITRNTDAKYVRNGSYSAKLQPIGGRISVTEPYFVMPVKSDKYEYDYSDFTNYKEVSAYLYNDSNENIEMTFGLVSAYSAAEANRMVGEKIVLEPKKWTRASYLVDWTFLSIAGDPTAIPGIYFQFPDTGVEYPDDAPSVYLDDVTLKKAKTKGVVNALDLDKSNTVAEICNFEKLWQKYAYTTNVTDRLGVVEVVNAEDYEITASSGKKVLRVLRYNEGDYFELSIPGKLFKAAGMDEVPEEEWASTYLCFDMWNSSDKYTQYHSMFYYKESGEAQNPRLWRGPDAKGNYYWESYLTWPRPIYNKWTTYKISLWELSRGMADKDYVLHPMRLKIRFATLPEATGNEWEIFFDNFRLEKGEKLKGV